MSASRSLGSFFVVLTPSYILPPFYLSVSASLLLFALFICLSLLQARISYTYHPSSHPIHFNYYSLKHKKRLLSSASIFVPYFHHHRCYDFRQLLHRHCIVLTNSFCRLSHASFSIIQTPSTVRHHLHAIGASLFSSVAWRRSSNNSSEKDKHE